MTTNEIIAELREKSELFNAEPLWLLLKTAADRLEELDKRVAIMMEGQHDT